jgi:NAD(P)-dependent dehydrogenase (short-subunit alcohol dehydrogenase family)
MIIPFILAFITCTFAQALSMPGTALITGSTDGIGVTTAKNMAAKGYNILIHGRDENRIQRAAKVVRSFAEKHSSDVQILTLPPEDISTVLGCERLVSHVRSVCEKKDLQLNVLMNNAGVYSEDLILTSDGLEQTFAVNVLAPFVITSLLLDTLLQSKSRTRNVIASSMSQCGSIRDWEDLHYSQRKYSAHGAYSESKLLDAMLSMEFAARLQEGGFDTDRITCNCLDPGTVNTKMLLAGWGRIGIEVEDALDQTWICTSPEVEDVTGQYFTLRSARRASSSAYDQQERDKMWKILSDLAPEAAKVWEF